MKSRAMSLARLIAEVTGDSPETVLARCPNLGSLWLEVVTQVDEGRISTEKCSRVWSSAALTDRPRRRRLHRNTVAPV